MGKPVILPLKTVRNPRDLGGYIGADGRKVLPNRLFRTGNISKISEEDAERLHSYGLKKIIDLRSHHEVEKCPDRKIEGVEHLQMPLSCEDNTKGGGDYKKNFERYREDQYAGFSMMCKRYHAHVTKPRAQKTIHDILEVLLNTKEGAVLYHCSEGKDRTGIVTMIILYILGVDLETIRQDYLFSNGMLDDYRARRDKYFKENGENLKFRANMRILGSVQDAFLDTALITIEEEYGGLDNYIEKQLKISPEMQEALRELYLEKK